MTGVLAPPVRPTRALGIYAFVLGVAALALLAAGAALLIALRGGAEPIAAAQGSPGSQVAQPIRTSFGAVAVEGTHVLGLAPPERGPHGAHPVGDKGYLEIRIALANTRARATLYSPGQFRLRLPTGRTITALRANVKAGLLRPNMTIHARLVFIAPVAAAPLALEFQDLARPQPLRVPIGRVHGAPTSATRQDPNHPHGERRSQP